MTFLGRAVGVKLEENLNGTHTLTFQMPDKYFDSEKGEYVRNEFVDNLFNERKLKLHFMDKWYEFYIKSVSEDKNFKSYMKNYTCSDAFIDELSRNGYGITFDTELYNNVEEVGTFTQTILEDSIWNYTPQYNWGDFTEYQEEKLFKIPIEMFGGKISGHKLNYVVEGEKADTITNAFTHKKRPLEIGDDLAREKEVFWDAQGGNMPLIGAAAAVETDGYIYVPYSCLDFCYVTTTKEGDIALAATEEVQTYTFKGKTSYAVAPNTVDPNALIQFIAIPKNAEVEVDEAGLLVNKNCTYVMTVEEWNNNIQSDYFYQFFPKKVSDKNKKRFIKAKNVKKNFPNNTQYAYGNWAAFYDGYLNKIGDLEVIYGKKISITDRTEINITEDIDQYVTVYNNNFKKYKDLYTNPDGQWKEVKDINYRVCSKADTRQIVPQLARNYIQNGVNIKSTDGWEIQQTYDEIDFPSAQIKFKPAVVEGEKVTDNRTDYAFIDFVTPYKIGENQEVSVPQYSTEQATIINFGIVGQEKEITNDKIYCLGIKGAFSTNNIDILIGEGGIIQEGDYSLKNPQTIELKKLLGENFTSSLSVTEDKKEYDFKEPTLYEGYILVKFPSNIKNPYIALQIKDTNAAQRLRIVSFWFFEAYTRGEDQFDEEGLKYRYSGRELFEDVIPIEYNGMKISNSYSYSKISKLVLFETDIMPGDTYEYQKYFIQQVQGINKNNESVADTFNQKQFLSADAYTMTERNMQNLSKNDLPFSSRDFTDEELTISTKYIDLNKCQYYKGQSLVNECDCLWGGGERICLYQKYGYCPYLFKTEKHCRKIRTLNGEKSNRFNLTQELSKVFEIYPMYWIEHDERGKVPTEIITKNGKAYERMKKQIFYITEKGVENKLGFRYEKNLSNISRTIKSDSIVTKLYVEDVDSDLSPTGLCTIKTAEDNPSKDNFILDFSYYTTKGILDKDMVNNDLYGKDSNDMGYLKQLGNYNKEYDKISNKIINLSSESYTELEANIDVNLESIETAQQQLRKYKKQMDRYKDTKEDIEENQTYQNYVTKYNEQLGILEELIKETFDTDGIELLKTYSIDELKEHDFIKKHTYDKGMLGQYNKEYNQIQKWKKEQAKYLRDINRISLDFYRKYEPYLKEGTWSDSNYLTDNAYYFGAKEVAAEGAIPKVEYNITVVDLNDYEFGVADTTYVEDIGMFGINPITGLPNRLKVIISKINYDLDVPTNNSISVQNFTTQFEDLFQQVTASVQSLTFNENIYKRSSNFTSNQNIEEDSLQGTLDTNDMTLLSTDENNIELDKLGQSGSDINNHNNKYKLNGQGLFFSNNGGQSWNIGVGPGGINADYINVGTLDAGKIRIVDNDYLYFLWDKNGITAFRDPQSTESPTFNDFALFNKYGLSLVEEGKIRLRAGYSFNGKKGDKEIGGNINTETSMGENIGFYLYNNKGQEIFYSAVNKNNQESADQESAKVYLVGEMYITDTVDNVESSSASSNVTYHKKYNIEELDCPIFQEITENVGNENNGNTDNGIFKKPTRNNGNNSDENILVGVFEVNGDIETVKNKALALALLHQIKKKELQYKEEETDKEETKETEQKTTENEKQNETDQTIYYCRFIQSSNKEENKEEAKATAENKEEDVVEVAAPMEFMIKDIVNGKKIIGCAEKEKTQEEDVVQDEPQATEEESSAEEEDPQESEKEQGETNKKQETEYQLDEYGVFTGYQYLAINSSQDYNTQGVLIQVAVKDSKYYYTYTKTRGQRLSSTTDETITGANVEATEVSYYDNSNNENKYPISKTTKQLYQLISNGSTTYWEEKEENKFDGDSEPITNSTNVSLYLNNTNIREGSTEFAKSTERLFCAAGNVSNDENVRNILSFRKDGTLYIGGQIADASSEENKIITTAENVPIDIDVVGPLLKAEPANQRIELSFNNLYDTESEKNLFDSLIDAGAGVNPHKHKLETALATLIPVEEEDKIPHGNYLPSPEDQLGLSDKIMYTYNNGQSFTTVHDFIKNAVTKKNGDSNNNKNEEIGEAAAKLFDIIVSLLRTGQYSNDVGQVSNTTGKAYLHFSNQVLSGSGKVKLTFEDSYTGNVVGAGASSMAYGLLDPGEEATEK